LPNVHLHGFVPHAALGPFYERAAALVCTSLREGFPNTFLEAWSRARPVLTTVDPDGVVLEEGIGRVAATVDELAEHLRAALAGGAEWEAMGSRARAYYLREHQPERILDRYETVLFGGPKGQEAACSR
jgi:glycosyltransferase involved in cell wall biosynthesis